MPHPQSVLTDGNSGWQKATIGGLATLLVIFISLFISQQSSLASTLAETVTKVAVLETNIAHQNKLLEETVHELRFIRKELVDERNRVGFDFK